MSSDFPTSKDSLTNPVAGDKTDSPSHAGQHTDANDAIEAIQTKVGVDSSAVTASQDYKLTNTSSSNPGHKHTLADGATDVTATKDEVNILDGVTADKDELNITGGGETTEKVLNVQTKTKAYSSSNQSNITDGVTTQVVLGAESYDVGGDFTSNEFTVPVTGYYLVIGQIMFSSVTVDDRYMGLIYKNSASVAIATELNGGSTSQAYVNPSTIDYFSAADTISLYCRLDGTDGGVDITSGANNTFLSIHLLSV